MDEDLDEEFDNFMHRVNEVSRIIENLASDDSDLQKIGELEAKEYLGEGRAAPDHEDVALTVKSDRTLLNRRAIEKDDQATMSKEAFMDEVSKDAEKRYRDKQIRRERMETLKKRANLAFGRDEYEKALTLYTKAIEQIRDSCLLYNNRALTYIKLDKREKAKEDLETALKIDEDCLKSLLLLAKVHFLDGNVEEYQRSLSKAAERNPERKNFIKEYQESLESEIASLE